KQSLSLTLRHYLPLAGSLKWPSDAPRPFILYAPDDGVSVIVAESDADFHRLSSNGIYEAVELHPLIPHLRSSDDSASILAIQITFFPSQGFSIGITAHHTVLEGKTTSMFMEIIKDPTGLDLDILYLNQRLICSSGNKSLKVPTNKRATP
ncbi:hypothetical protein Gohar_012479, partial [Gossypium harknessii]|nr:hypothetical protein [Gossypium harknessii]